MARQITSRQYFSLILGQRQRQRAARIWPALKNVASDRDWLDAMAEGTTEFDFAKVEEMRCDDAIARWDD